MKFPFPESEFCFKSRHREAAELTDAFWVGSTRWWQREHPSPSYITGSLYGRSLFITPSPLPGRVPTPPQWLWDSEQQTKLYTAHPAILRSLAGAGRLLLEY